MKSKHPELWLLAREGLAAIRRWEAEQNRKEDCREQDLCMDQVSRRTAGACLDREHAGGPAADCRGLH